MASVDSILGGQAESIALAEAMLAETISPAVSDV